MKLVDVITHIAYNNFGSKEEVHEAFEALMYLISVSEDEEDLELMLKAFTDFQKEAYKLYNITFNKLPNEYETNKLKKVIHDENMLNFLKKLRLL